MTQPTGQDQVTILQNRITDEIFFALGFGRVGFMRRVFGGLFSNPALRFARIAAMKIETIGPVPHAPFFLVCNHLSYMDIPAIRAVVDGVFVAKADIRGWFVAGKIISDMGMIFIDRQNRRDIRFLACGHFRRQARL